MAKVELRRPFFVVNPKSYLYGKELIDLAKCADELAIKYDVDIIKKQISADTLYPSSK